MPRRWQLLATIAMVTCFTSGWFLQRQASATGDVYQQARLFETVLEHVRDYHVDSVGENDLYRKATDGLLTQLRDPYAALLSGTDLERHVERTTGDYAGIGLLVDARNGWVTVVTPMHGLARGTGRHPNRRPPVRGGWGTRRGLDAGSGGQGDARRARLADRHRDSA